MQEKPKPQRSRHCVYAIVFAIAVPLCMAALLIIPAGRRAFLDLTAQRPYLMGFVKFALLASTGEILSIGVSTGIFVFPRGAVAKAAVWGIIGMMIALLMPVYSAGVAAAQEAALLPGAQSPFATAIFISVIMNCTFGVAMMAFHRVTDHVIEHWRGPKVPRVRSAVRAIDWPGFISFVVLRTVPFFWIPAHTITFLLPEQYRVFMSAMLSIVLGLLLALGKKRGGAK